MISVIIPTYNRAVFLEKALKTVLMQKEVKCEVVIIDDCSNDNTGNIANAYKNLIDITYIKNDRTRGPGYSRLLGLKNSVGEYVVFMDDDDYYTDSYFYKKAISIFEKDKESRLAFVSGNAQILFHENGKIMFNKLNVEGYIEGLEYLLHFQEKYNKPLSTFSTVFSKKKLENGGIYHMKMANDSSIYMRALLAGSAYIMEDIIGVYVVHSKNISNNISDRFLIQNLAEKADIRDCLKKKLDTKQLRNWWANQAGLTLQYYVNGSKPSVEEFRHVSDWIKGNSSGYSSWRLKKIMIKSFTLVIKNKVGIKNHEEIKKYIIFIKNKFLLNDKALNLNYFEIVVTTKCTLKCENCANLMQYYHKPTHVQYDVIERSVKRLLDCIDRVERVGVLGGETFLYPELDKVIYLLESSPKVKSIRVVTNGTIIPKDEKILKALACRKVVVQLNNYTNAYVEVADKVAKLFDERKIKYSLLKKDGQEWLDYGSLSCRNRNRAELVEQFKKCRIGCHSLYNGKLFYCPRSGHGMDLELLPEAKEDYVDLMDMSITMEEVRKTLYALLYEKKYIDACNYCDMGTEFCKPIPAAIQKNKGEGDACSQKGGLL